MSEQEVKRLLKSCSDLKVQSSGDSALQAAERAYKAAANLNPPNTSLRCEAAYRWAHLLLRKCELSRAELWRIDELLCEAFKDRLLGYLPLVYRLPVLNRLKAVGEDLAAAYLQDNWKDLVREFSRDDLKFDFLQNTSFNLVELAGYFLGESTKSLVGLGALDPRRTRDSWIVVGNDVAEYEWIEPLAKNEFQEKALQRDRVFLIELSARTCRWGWKEAGQEQFETSLCECNDQHARILIHMASDPSLSNKELQSRLSWVEESITRNTLNQARVRIKKKMSQLTGSDDPCSVFAEPGSFRLADDFPVLALCQVSVLEGRDG